MIITILCTFEMTADIFVGKKNVFPSQHTKIYHETLCLQSKRHSIIPIPIVFKRTDFRHLDALCYKEMFTLYNNIKIIIKKNK